MRNCGCGRLVRWFEAWTCQVCGAPCCPECAYTPESTEFCSGCAPCPAPPRNSLYPMWQEALG